MLDGILSPEAARLYDNLRAGATVLADTTAASEIAPVQELQRHGLVKETVDDPPCLVALEPRSAIAASVARVMDQIADNNRVLSHIVEEALRVHGVDDGRNTDLASVQILTDGRQINVLSSAIVESARSEIVILNTASSADPGNAESVGLSPEQQARNVTLRSVYHVDCLRNFGHLIDASIAQGESARISDHVPTKLIMADRRRAMLPLDATGMGGAVLIEAPPILDALQSWFEFIWDRAIPYGATEDSGDLTPLERRVLILLATGSKDEVIAQRLNVTVRTVRRHITSAMNKLGAENRFAAGVLASRRGWI